MAHVNIKDASGICRSNMDGFTPGQKRCAIIMFFGYCKYYTNGSKFIADKYLDELHKLGFDVKHCKNGKINLVEKGV